MISEKNCSAPALNYGSLISELKEKISLIRSNSGHVEYSNENVQVKTNGGARENKNKDANSGEQSVIKKANSNLKPDENNTASFEGKINAQTPLDKSNGVMNYESNKDEAISFKYSKPFPYPICFVSKSLPTPPTDYNLRKVNADLNEKENNETSVLGEIGAREELTAMPDKGENVGKITDCVSENARGAHKNLKNRLNSSSEYAEGRKQIGEYGNETKYCSRYPNNAVCDAITDDGAGDDYNISGSSQIDLSKFGRNFIVESQKLSAITNNARVNPQNRNLDQYSSVNLPKSIDGSECCKIDHTNNKNPNCADSSEKRVMLAENNGTNKNLSEFNNGSKVISGSNKNTELGFNCAKKQQRRNIFTTRYYIMASKLRVIQ
ncbi:hypothetical protein FG386_002320 [Cryptosporidium ryanae]|uniref:uncharacterized protein n=1 Tax=Cryptosporidium ryanae TaxID=515981 RepID=UPI00351A8BC1|nr:hypothetical protein FG386_002320 [Cryptosporidium ryanae]